MSISGSVVPIETISAAQPPGKSIPADGRDHSKLYFLDGLRGLAALVVLVGHARWLLWEGFAGGYKLHPQQYSLVGKVCVYLFSVFRFGHEAVLFFFVLSGFVIHLRYSRGLVKDPQAQFDYLDFYKRRIRRIYPLFLFTLLLTFLLDKIGMCHGFSIYAGRTPVPLLNNNVHTNHELINLAGNLLFVSTDRVGIWGTNGPLWSLKYEWWFYMFYPILFLLTRKSFYLSLAVVVAAFLLSMTFNAAIAPFFFSVFQYLLSWWLGAVTADIYTRRIRVNPLYFSVFAVFIPLMIVKPGIVQNDALYDTLWAVGFFGLVNLLLWWKARRPASLRALEKIKWLGDCSYSLYVTHFPILVLLNGILLHYTANRMPQVQWLFIAVSLLLIGWGYIIYRLIERPFLKTRAKRIA